MRTRLIVCKWREPSKGFVFPDSAPFYQLLGVGAKFTAAIAPFAAKTRRFVSSLFFVAFQGWVIDLLDSRMPPLESPTGLDLPEGSITMGKLTLK
ncbi:hypothetical protein SAY87_019247 [Trapa incisa]|uniref:Uncharacterized protein n=1 Tax=Trapa incisa TaxID=236973 RepID=A0AAN7K182_9MYRT|nr:hypothetical protein SAY87_019247 [Trapa incisa]